MTKTSKEPHGRREFLKRAAVAGGAVAVAAGAKAAGAAEGRTASRPVPETAPESRGYRMTSHVERYYRLARF